MAFCRSCGNEISPQARACPSCGHPAAGVATHTGELAGFGIRFVAWLIDLVILAVAGLLLPFVALIGGFLYGWLMVALNDGRTLGKMAMGIRVARPDGSPVDIGYAAARAAMEIVSGLALGLGYLWAAWDAERRTWHDMVANTRVFVSR